jgi:hypothetical protein
MKKYLFSFYAFSALLLATSPSFAATNPFGTSPAPAPASINIYDWYNLGEMTAASTQLIFNFTVAEDMDDTYKQIYDLMTKTQLSDGTINAFKQWYPVLKALPWDKNFQTWTKEQQNTWNKSPLQVAWNKALHDDAAKSVETEFFYWLGYHAILVAWAVPIYQNNNWTDWVTSLIGSTAQDYAYFATDPSRSGVFGALTPDVQNAMTFIAAAKKKTSSTTSPFDKGGQSGLTADDVAKIVEAAKAIRAAAQANQLTK